MVQEFVGICHGNLSKVMALYEKEPRLVFASHDWGTGDFESGIEAAGHTVQKLIAAFLLGKGARVNFFLLCMLERPSAFTGAGKKVIGTIIMLTNIESMFNLIKIHFPCFSNHK